MTYVEAIKENKEGQDRGARGTPTTLNDLDSNLNDCFPYLLHPGAHAFLYFINTLIMAPMGSCLD